MSNNNPYEGDSFFYPAPVHSSVREVGEYVTQTITTIDGHVKTFKGVDTKTIMKGDFTHFNTKDGRKVLVNNQNVLFVEIEKEI